MYQVLYRKWRPKSFDDVVGQDHVCNTLKNQIKLSKIAHAYLFIGSRGTGKTTCAKILAKAINCLEQDSENIVKPCNECESCNDIEKNTAVDVVEMDAASNNSVNDIRNICEEALFPPVKSKYRVYIIDEVHMLSTGAFNALLKTLEEPPEHVVFILATTEVHKIPTTILSRCQRFEFNRLSEDSIIGRLSFICKEEKIKVEKDALKLIARLADGALRDALSILDKCVSLGKKISEEIVEEISGVIDDGYLIDLAEKIIDSDFGGILKIIDELSFKSKDMLRLCQEMILTFRDLMIVKSVKNTEEVFAIREEKVAKCKDLAQKITLEKIIRNINIFESSVQNISKGCNKRIETEVAFLKACIEEKEENINSPYEDLKKRIQKLEAMGLRESKNLQIESRKVEPHDFSKIEKLSENAVPFSSWEKVLLILRNYSQTLPASFLGSKAYENGEYLLIDAKNDVAFELLRKPSQRDKMRLAIQDVTGKVYKLGPYKKEHEEKKEEEVSLDEFVNDVSKEDVEVTVV